MIKLIATDMDGTFLREDHQFNRDRFRKILDQFHRKGYLFAAASGRSLLSLQAIFQGFEDEMAFVAENGSIVSYKGKMIFEDQPIEPIVYLELVRRLSASPYGQNSCVVLSGKNGAYLLKSGDREFIERISPFYVKTSLVSDFSEVTEDIVKIVATFPTGEVEVAQEWLNQEFDGVTAVTTGFNSVDIILSDSHKAVGLSKLCEYCGLEATDVVAFGDNQNDLEMLEFAGIALATSNARPEVKQIVDRVIGHCNDEAVLAYIEEMLDEY
ncbi:Cof-type HAD-IIB family hydrolase [Streptococcus sp. zg-86]|uniref:Cof-type HAD-IIB family hydrolase n=1 Tax=Streptococcus zhangguiae TaxID=2664091 RepID=A0A6I4RTY1_9STRE|nr:MULTISPECIES: Cof-type HAD-IIB family hydrolase [unclassified Streptococcus]MTB64505.1 Cof-type HAD-IIB family hydrolase [Streptococcus sp. zg-86]MTB90805.1 Cof-type HAD-IIB family hydrolase [Streptococcus sp. zg-36]MWV56492.1 Cof-type HAD-IIB family hydrolase [Streptococcus sp. zg-70]QTH47302.1 HAD family hydrolase [Streptococcus sp. zg-86]